MSSVYYESVSVSKSELTALVQPSTVTEGDNVSLTCVSGCPTPETIVWFKDGQLVANPVFQARRENAGRYYCAVLGQEFVISVPVALNVHCKYTTNTSAQVMCFFHSRNVSINTAECIFFIIQTLDEQFCELSIFGDTPHF